MAHSTTMTHEQREMLVHTLTMFYDIQKIARLTDVELHEQWLFGCKYDGGVEHLKD